MKVALALALIFTTTCLRAADIKFAVVDMAKAFTEYHKTKEAASTVKENKDKAQKDLNERYSVYRNLMSDAQKLVQKAQDPLLNAEAKAKTQAEVGDKQKELRALEQEITEFQQRRTMQLKQEEVGLTRGLYDEIVTIVKDKSKSSGYDLVFDKSGASMSTIPVLLYYKDATDFTDEVIVELNKNAPAPKAATAEKDKKEEAKK
jgi:outer membrane protein